LNIYKHYLRTLTVKHQLNSGHCKLQLFHTNTPGGSTSKVCRCSAIISCD